MHLSFPLTLLLLSCSSCHKIPKCCPLGQLLAGGGCISMKSGTALPKIKVGGNMVSFKWLKDQKMLRQGSVPRCVKQDEVFPEFTETTTLGESMQYFSTDGVFISDKCMVQKEEKNYTKLLKSNFHIWLVLT